jgi:hypothetical protein
MEPYHLRRREYAITERTVLLEIIAGQKYLTLALCHAGEPYLVTMNYGFDPESDCFYIHCADEGKKLEYWRANPTVWGQVLEDRGYVASACDHAYRTVQFKGHVALINDPDEKRRALALMIEQLSPNPALVASRLLKSERLARVTVARIDVESFSGKYNPSRKN